MRLAVAAVAIVGALFGGVYLVNDADATATASHVMPLPARTFWMGRPCATEDSTNCYWNDGSGHPLYSRKMPSGRVCRFYVQRQYARHHDHCLVNH